MPAPIGFVEYYTPSRAGPYRALPLRLNESANVAERLLVYIDDWVGNPTTHGFSPSDVARGSVVKNDVPRRDPGFAGEHWRG